MRNGVERGESAKGRKVKFVRLLGAALNTGIINVVERKALAQPRPLIQRPPVGIREGENGQKRVRDRAPVG